MKIHCLEHYLLWMKWVRAKKNKPTIKMEMIKHIETCEICQEKIKQKERK